MNKYKIPPPNDNLAPLPHSINGFIIPLSNKRLSFSDSGKDVMLSGKIGVKAHIKDHKEYLTDADIKLG